MCTLGKFDLSVPNEFGSLNSSVFKINIHTDWNFQHERFDADVAVLVLNEKIKFDDFIQPVCLPKINNDNNISGIGTAVGWGKSDFEPDYSFTLNKVSMPAVNTSFCFKQVPLLARYMSRRQFCAGYLDQEKGICLYDSGGGYFLHRSSKWETAGILSSSLWGGKYGCDVNTFQVFTNVAMFVPWIKKIVDDTNEVSPATIEFECTRIDDKYKEFECIKRDLP